MEDKNFSINSIEEDPVRSKSNEIVERKGLGHPDTLADGIAESISRELCREYRDRFGRVLHHNTDEVQIVAGSSNPGFGGGKIIDPIYILLAGRATKKFDGRSIEVDRIAKKAARNYLDENLEHLEDSDVTIESGIGETSTDLKSNYSNNAANDTSFGISHAPLSPAEKTVKKVEKELRDQEVLGEDIKIMANREEDLLRLTVASAYIDSRVNSIEEYVESKEEMEEKIRRIAEKETELETTVGFNQADRPEKGEVYLTVTGTSAEMGDDGSVGRGNRVNGLITAQRPVSLEAASGKNPVTHIGKLYNLAAKEIARDIYENTGEFAQVKLLSQIGKPVDDPEKVEVDTPAGREAVRNSVEEKLASLDEIRDRCIKGEIEVF